MRSRPALAIALAFVCCMLLAVSRASGQTGAAAESSRAPSASAAGGGLRPLSPESPDSFGTFCCDILMIPAAAFVPRASNIDWVYTGQGYVSASANPNADRDVFWAPVALPSGAKIRFMGFFYDDADPANDITATLRQYTGFSDANTTFTNIASVTSSGSGGRAESFDSLGLAGHDVNNGSAQYAVVINVPVISANLGFKAVEISWQRQISPAPVTATFGDVPTSHTYFRAIEALNASGITQGCGNGNFCPQQNVTRGEMAAFLARALGLHFYYPPF